MSEKWVRDTGLVFSLLFLILGARGNTLFLWLSGLFLLALLFYPNALTPVAFLWLKFAEIFGGFMNKVFFGIVFFVVITPIAYVRRTLSKDDRSLSPTGKNSTAFVDRGQIISSMDMERPY